MRITKANAVLPELFVALWSQSGRSQTPESFQFLNQWLIRSSLWS